MNKPQNIINKIMRVLNLRVVRAKQYDDLLENLKIISNRNRVDRLFARMNPDLINAFEYPIITSQLGQEIFVLSTLGLKRNGFFVEFGATDGISLSNTYVLERHFGWTGILAEPARNWHKALTKNRLCDIDFRCIYSSNGKIMFKETSLPELSTISHFESGDLHANYRSSGEYYEVETITLSEFLKHHNAPVEIDYISIDTEGSELDILTEFDFSKYSVKTFTIEHNFTSSRSKIERLMKSKGYNRVFAEISNFDDWYVLGD
jgi:FkbM family methyltransferase